jgi:hypothetical protein
MNPIGLSSLKWKIPSLFKNIGRLRDRQLRKISLGKGINKKGAL